MTLRVAVNDNYPGNPKLEFCNHCRRIAADLHMVDILSTLGEMRVRYGK